MKSLIKLASLAAVVLALTGCSDCCYNPCEKSCAPRCCPAPQIWDNNCCEQGPY